jgi:hypothetical protein
MATVDTRDYAALVSWTTLPMGNMLITASGNVVRDTATRRRKPRLDRLMGA